ncbi:TonB-dependent receptor [Adhaeribacter radiodurans]|uniref:TonB-dependent receptor n=1 Tax=Adhaeribacter radiodurans TaxID=2745197 RepID=A0A7L7L8M6_9BACT|nr:TonB-dependent receptor [Adhaeribacter radiodurans]QMU29074.1 TonB-dependent receptor [Adhaeribacter radiodurans]
MKKSFTLFSFLLISISLLAQNSSIKGRVMANGEPLAYASVGVMGTRLGATSNDKGYYEIKNIPPGSIEVGASSIGYQSQKASANLTPGSTITINFILKEITSKLEEIVVTGVTRATEVKKSPIPIATISKKEININVNSNIIDAIVKGVPGVSATTTGPNISKPFIRGLGYNRVLNMYDGIRQEGQQWGDEHGTEVDQYGIDRAEVVKGPASLTYGSDALAGVINMIPAIPKGVDGKLKGDLLTDFHSNNGLIGTSLGISYNKSDWKFYLRGTQKRAHNYQNPVDGWVYGSAYREYNLSGTARVDKTWGFSQISTTLYDNLQEIPDGSRDSLSRKFTKPIREGNEDEIKNRPIVPDNELKTYAIGNLHQAIQHYRVYTHNQFIIGQGNINATFGFQQSRRREFLFPTLPDKAALFLVLNTFNYDVHYNLPTWNGLETTLGVNGMYQTNQNKDATNFPIPDYDLFDVGTFVFTKRTLGKFDVSGGIRYDTRHLTWNDFYTGTNATGFGQKVNAQEPGAYLQFPEFTHQYHGISGSLGATYNLSDQILLKANLARGYRSPNINEVGSNGLDPGAHIRYQGNREFKPEFNFQKDISFLAYLKNLDISVELFDNRISNYIFQARLSDDQGQPIVDDQGNLTYKYQQSKAQLYGGEFTLNLHPESVPWLNFNNSLAYVNGINKNSKLRETYGDAAKYLPFILPLHYRSEIRGTLRKSVGAYTGIYARLELDAYGRQNKIYAVDNTETPTSGYVLFNTGVGTNVKQKSGRVFCQLFFQVNNLFDKAYQSHLNRLKYFEYFQASPNNHRGIYNMGRNFSAKVIIPF